MLPAVAQAAVVLLQREIPDAINVAVAVHARQHGVTVILDLGGDDAPPPKYARVFSYTVLTIPYSPFNSSHKP